MQFLNAAAIMAIAFSLPAMTAKSGATPKCVADSKLLTSVPQKFSLAILAPDGKGRINLQVADPVIVIPYGLYSGISIDVPQVGLANVDPTIFSLKNKKLITGGSDAEFLSDDRELSYIGLRSFVFNSNFPDDEPANFTATGACDSYGRSFVRLGGADGEFVARMDLLY